MNLLTKRHRIYPSITPDDPCARRTPPTSPHSESFLGISELFMPSSEYLAKHSLQTFGTLSTTITSSRLARLTQQVEGDRFEDPALDDTDLKCWRDVIENAKANNDLDGLEFAILSAFGEVEAVMEENVSLRWHAHSLEEELQDISRAYREKLDDPTKTGTLVEAALRTSLEDALSKLDVARSELNAAQSDLYSNNEKFKSTEERLKAYEGILTRYDRELRFLKPSVVEDWRNITDARAKKKKTYANKLGGIFGLMSSKNQTPL